MPDLVKVCTESVKKHNPEHKVILVTETNYNQYIVLPDFIVSKYKNNIIPPAQFSDIIRLALLEKHGGIWLDSTIYLTDKLPEIAFSSEFFTYKNPIGLNIEQVRNFKQLEMLCNFINLPVMLPSTWFISSASNNIVISNWLKLLLEYWKNENTLVDYFIMDYFFVLLILQNDICRKIFTDIPAFLTLPAEMLQAAMPEEFNDDVFETVKSVSPIHKLTLKYTPDNSIQNRFYNKIISKK